MRSDRYRGLLDQAIADHRAAEAATGLTVREVRDLPGLTAVAALLDTVWRAAPHAEVMPLDVLVALSMSDNYVSAVYDGAEIVAASVGFRGSDGRVDCLHSHVTGVRPGYRSRRIGFTVKLHQRRWALAHGLRSITWTYDPLVRRNAVFNLLSLGAEVTGFVVNLYGDAPDGINTDGATDRFTVRWPLLHARVQAACSGVPVPEPAVDPGASCVALSVAGDGAPAFGALAADAVLCQIPADIEQVRDQDLTMAKRWRVAMQDTMAEAYRRGLGVTAVTRDGWYVLEARA